MLIWILLNVSDQKVRRVVTQALLYNLITVLVLLIQPLHNISDSVDFTSVKLDTWSSKFDMQNIWLSYATLTH